MAGTEYLFIDGGYLRAIHSRLLNGFFGATDKIDFLSIKSQVGVEKAFYYDCLDDVRKEGETDAEFTTRIKEQEEFFNHIRSLPGFHVRLGTLSGGAEKPRQKQVDVLLAVDMLNHAFHKNMARASLIAGDLDFKPILDTLILLGTYARVLYERRSAARNLYWAADVGQEVTLREMYQWTIPQFRQGHPIPYEVQNETRPGGYQTVRRGSFDGKPVELLQQESNFVLYVTNFSGGRSLSVRFTDPTLLERYFSIVYGQVAWA